jgi:hypothetical protein
MEELFKTIITPLNRVEQREYIQNIVGSNNNFKKDLINFRKNRNKKCNIISVH